MLSHPIVFTPAGSWGGGGGAKGDIFILCDLPRAAGRPDEHEHRYCQVKTEGKEIEKSTSLPLFVQNMIDWSRLNDQNMMYE